MLIRRPLQLVQRYRQALIQPEIKMLPQRHLQMV